MPDTERLIHLRPAFLLCVCEEDLLRRKAGVTYSPHFEQRILIVEIALFLQKSVDLPHSHSTVAGGLLVMS